MKEKRRVEKVQQHALKSGTVMHLKQPIQAETDQEDCHICFEPFDGYYSTTGRQRRPMLLACCGYFVCNSCLQHCPSCPFCRAFQPDEAGRIAQLRALAEKGSMYAQFDMGRSLCNGLVIAKDQKQGLIWLKRAADQGLTAAKERLGYELKASSWSSKKATWTSKKAKALLAQGANEGYPLAQCEIASWENVDGNFKTAVKWYTLAAAQGHTTAMAELARFYSIGVCGLKVSVFRAMFWARKAAMEGVGDAQSILADCLIEIIQQAYAKEEAKYMVGASHMYKASLLPEACFWARKAFQDGSFSQAQEAWRTRILQRSEAIRDSRCACCWTDDRKPLEHRCEKCNGVAYCSEDCRRRHWEMGHKGDCFTHTNHRRQDAHQREKSIGAYIQKRCQVVAG